MAQVYEGTGVSSGVAVGDVWLVEGYALPVVPIPVPPERVDYEVALVEAARDAVRQELTGLRDRTRERLGETYAGILGAQLMIVDDPQLVAQTLQRIRLGRVAAAWALKETIADFERRFAELGDDYIRERAGDLEDVHQRLQHHLRGPAPDREHPPEGPLIVVAHSLGPSDAAALPLDRVIGLAIDGGSRTSHTAILAQALGLPAVVGLHDLSARVRSGEAIVVDGDAGSVVWMPDADAVAQFEERRRSWIESERPDSADLGPVATVDGTAVRVRANIEFPEEVERAVGFGAEGVGLYRSEFLFLSRAPRFPDEEEHYRTYRAIAEAVAPHPAVIRTFDLGGEKYFHEVLHQDARHPALGLRGIRLCLRRPDLFVPQVRGLLRAAAEAEIRVMLPLVTGADEITAVRSLMAEQAEALRAEGKQCREDLPLGIMVEVPAAAAAADLLAQECDFFSIGTNDLMQYTLAVDRGSDALADLVDPLHPSLVRMLRFIVDAADQEGIPVSLCGEMAADPEVTELLIGLGLTELSVPPRAVPLIRRAVQACHAGRAGKMADEVVDSGSAEAARQIMLGAPDVSGGS